MQRFYLKKLNDVEVKELCQVKFSNRFAVLENLDDNVNVNRAWKILEYTKFIKSASRSLCFKEHKPWLEK
jgi:hypothetical protein